MAQKKQQRTFIKWYQPCEEFDILCSFPFTWVCDKKIMSPQALKALQC